MTFLIRSAGYPMAEWDATIDRWNVLPPDSLVEGDFGDFLIEIGATWDVTGATPIRTAGTDRTTFRDVPTVRQSFTFGDPFGELSGALRFPAVQIFDDVVALFPRLTPVDIWRVLPAAEAADYGDTNEVGLGYPAGCAPYWHGFVQSAEFADGPGVGGGATVQLLGAFFGETSLRGHQPQFLDPTPANDVGTFLAQALDLPGHSRPYSPFTGFVYTSDTTGILSRHRGSRGQYVADYCEEILSIASDSLGRWTIGRKFETVTGRDYPVARAYELRYDSDDVTDAIQVSTVAAGGFGVAPSLSIDYTEAPSSVYGEGTAKDGSRWRNARYPQLTTTAPAYPDRISGSDYPLVITDDDSLFTDQVITQLNAQLRLAGWPDVEIGDTFTADTETAIVALKEARNWPNNDPEIESNAAWDLCWETGTGTTEYSSGFFMALAETAETTAFEYAADGDVVGAGPGYTGAMRVDRMVSFPDKTAKSRAATYARRVINADRVAPLEVPPTLDFSATSTGLAVIGVGGAVDWVSTPAYGSSTGSARLTINPTGAASDVIYWGTTSGAQWPVSPGLTYTAFAALRAAATARTIYMTIDWFDASSVYIDSSTQTSVVHSTGGWTNLTNEAVAPPTAAYARAVLQIVADLADGEIHYVGLLTLTGPTTVPMIGTVTLTADPTDEDAGARSRMGIREGGWLQVNNLNAGTYARFHVAGITVNPDTRKSPAQLTVSTANHPLLDLVTRIERDQEAKTDPAKAWRSMRSRIHRPWKDAVGFDRESGAGLVAPHSHPGGEWIVKPLIGAQRGQVEVIKATVSPATEFALALFASELDAADITAIIADPLATEPDGYGWFNHPDNEAALAGYGLINAWGTFEEPCGYGRGSKQATPPATLTGKFLDEAPQSFVSDDPPWLWLAEWCVDPADSISADMRVIIEE